MTDRYIPKVGDRVQVRVAQYGPGGTVDRFWRSAVVEARSIRGITVRFLDGTRDGVEIDKIRPRKTEDDSR